MRSTYTHDIIVIGAGSGGLTSAIFMQRAGFKVLLIDRKKDTFGGDCLNYGCVPSKALLHISKLVSDSDKSTKFREQTSGGVDIKKVMDYVRERKAIIRKHENPDYLQSLGIDIAIGNARFKNSKTVTVDSKLYSAKHIVIATGSRARELQLDGLETISHYNNETVFDMTELPKQFVFIGGGPINIELGQAFARLGSNVTILQGGQRILDKEESEVSELMESLLTKEGVKIYCNAEVQRVKAGKVEVMLDGTNTVEVPADALFIGIGRIPNIDKLDIEAAGIELTTSKNLKLDKYLRTTNKRIVAVGDAAGMHMFTHAAEVQAQVVLNNFFSPLLKKYSSKKIAWVTFTDPEIATFGANNKQLQDAGTRFSQLMVKLSEDDRSITDDATDGFLKLYLGRNGKILGGVMVGQRAGEITSELVLMMYKNLPISSVLGKTFPYPIASRVILDAARAYSGRKLYSRFNKKILKLLYG